MIFIGFNNYDKSGRFYFIPAEHQYKSYYYYFSTRIYADKHDISRTKAHEILNNQEIQWRKDNNLYLDIEKKFNLNESKDNLKINQDYLKAIEYRNKKFLEIAISNPIYLTKFFIKRVLLMSQFSPTWTTQSYNNDRHSLEANINPAKYYNRNLIRNIFYSLIIYPFIILGFLFFLKDLFIKKNFSNHNKFLIFQIISIFYFVAISGFWGNPKYFVPCIINLSFFMAQGLSLSIIFFKKKLFNKINE